jgi:DNA replication protein DnaC
MLSHPTFDQLRTLKLTGMLKALQEQEQMPDIDRLNFLERLGLLVDREAQERDNRRLTTRLRFARLKQAASLEDLDLNAKATGPRPDPETGQLLLGRRTPQHPHHGTHQYPDIMHTSLSH